MDALFNDYITNIVDKAYHRLLTSDNVSKFRPEIIDRLESRSRSRSYLQMAAAELAEMKEITEEAAKELVFKYLHEIIEAFRNMDDILNEINQKNTQYQKAAVNRAKFLLSGDEDVRGQLKEILLGIHEKINEEEMNLGGIYEISFLEGLVRLYSCSFLDEKSFYSPTEGRKEFVPQKLEAHEIDEEARRRKLQKMMEKMKRVLSAGKIESYVLEQMGDRREMQASKLPLGSSEDFVKIIYVRLYGQRKNLKYKVEPGEMTEVNGFRFRDFKIRRK